MLSVTDSGAGLQVQGGSEQGADPVQDAHQGSRHRQALRGRHARECRHGGAGSLPFHGRHAAGEPT